MRPFDFENSVGFWVCTTAHMLRKRLDARLAEQGVTSRQWEVLAVLAMHGEMPQGQLAERLGIEAPALGGLVSRMERDGWLVRTPDPADRRRVLIRPAERAEEVWSASVDYFRELRTVVTQGLSAEDLATLRDTCETIRGNLIAADRAGSAGVDETSMQDTAVDVDMIALPGHSPAATTCR